jgi:hypothetical protein
MEAINCPETSATNLRHETTQQSVVSGFRREADDKCLLLGYYAASSGNSLPKRRGGTDSLYRNVGMGPTGCTETSVMDCHYSLRNNPEDRSFQGSKAQLRRGLGLQRRNHVTFLRSYSSCSESCAIYTWRHIARRIVYS